MKFPASLKIPIVLAAVCLAAQCHANLVVTNTADSGPGTLRDILAQAQSGDSITFDVTGVLTNRTSELVISNNVSIIGPGSGVLTVTGNTNAGPRIFTVWNGVTASVSGLTLRDSYTGSAGGAISNAGALSITNCVFKHCRAGSGSVPADQFPGGLPGGPGANGGAIYNSGSLTLVNCDFYTNVAGLGGYGLAGPNGNGGDSGNGGAIYSSGTLLAMNCNFLTNSAPDGGAGGSGFIMPTQGGSPNGSPSGKGGEGGAIYATGPATFVNCAFGYNSSGAGGKAGAGLSGNSTSPPGGNGGNGANGGNGGAIFSLGQLTLTSCTIANNQGGKGGAGGAAGAGYFSPGGNGGNGGGGGNGGLYCTGTVQVTACTFFINMAGVGGNAGSAGAGGTGARGGNGGYGGHGGFCGAIYANSSNALMTLQNVAFSLNSPGGFGAGTGGGAGTPTGTAGTNGLSGGGTDLFGTAQSLGHNYMHSAGNTGFTNGVKGDMVDLNLPIFISPLRRNGGPTLTCPISNPTSYLVDAGDDAIVASPLNLTTDQRGFPRITGAHVDIGASELQLPTTPLTIYGSLSNETMLVTFTNVPGIFQPRVWRTPTPEDASTFGGVMTEITPGVYQWTDDTVSSGPQQFYEVRWP